MKRNSKTRAMLVGGAAIGAVNGLFGGGGGMVAVPVLERVGMQTPSAHATAIAVILPASLISGLIYLLAGFSSLPLLLPTAIGVTAGGVLGARLLPRMRVFSVDLLFAALMLFAGVRMLFP